MSTFDINSLMEKKTQALSTATIPIPEGIFPFTVAGWEFKDGKRDESGDAWYAAVAQIDVQVTDDMRAEMGLGDDVQTLRRSKYIYLDLVDDGSGGMELDDRTGKNVQLGRFREAIGQNEEGTEWGFPDAQGARGAVQISHRIYEGSPRDQIDRFLEEDAAY